MLKICYVEALTPLFFTAGGHFVIPELHTTGWEPLDQLCTASLKKAMQLAI